MSFHLNEKTGSTRRSRCRRAAAMMEMIFVLPLLFTIMAFCIFFGKSFTRTQHARVMDRYEAWRMVTEGGGPSVNNLYGTSEMNQTFFGGNAESIGESRSRFDYDEAENVLIITAAAESEDAGFLYERMFEDLPDGTRARFSTFHPETVPALQDFEGAIEHEHRLQGNNWKMANGPGSTGNSGWIASGSRVAHMNIVADEFFMSFDNVMSGMANNRYASMIRSYYRTHPGYRGPDVP